jgi:hypothetical protein
MNKFFGVVIIIILAVVAMVVFSPEKANGPGSENLEKNSLIRVSSPQNEDTIESPLIVTGEARGYWFFEASAPMVLTDWDGKIIAQSYVMVTPPADLSGDPGPGWMTEDFVPFNGVIEFTRPIFGDRGTLILQKDNPSGLPEYDDAIEIPVRFNSGEGNEAVLVESDIREIGESCVVSGGTWLPGFNQCEYIGVEWCVNNDGIYAECESACRNDPNAEICTLQCVPVCSFGN